MRYRMKNGMKKQQPGFWTYFAITLTIVAGMLSANLKAETTPSFTVEVIGNGKPVLMIPGLMSNREVWRPTAEALAGQYQLHLISIAGFAGTTAVQGELLPRVKADLLQYIEQQQLLRPAVIGHSLGAFMAFNLASSAPDKIGTIIAVDGLPYLAPVFSRNPATTPEIMQPQADYLRNMYRQMSSQQLAAMAAQGVNIQATSPQHQQQVIEMATASDAAAVGQAVYELLTTDLRSEVSKIQGKVLLLGASGAISSDAEHAAALALYQQQIDTIANAMLEFNRQSRHFMMWDQPQWLVERIRQALQE